MKTLLAISLIVGFAFTGFCGTTNETNSVAQIQPEQLVSRHYTISAEIFWDNLKHLAGIKEDEDNLQMLRRFFEKNGVEMNPPTVIFLDLGPFPKPLEGKNVLFTRATEANQNKMERIVTAIQNNAQPSEIQIH